MAEGRRRSPEPGPVEGHLGDPDLRTSALGGHVERAGLRARARRINSCRNRHCPKCPAAAARRWLEDREAELLRFPTISSSSPCRPRSAPSRPGTRRPSRPPVQDRPETLTTIAADRRIWRAHRPDRRTAHLGSARPTIRISAPPFPAAACRRTVRAGPPASPASSCPCACSACPPPLLKGPRPCVPPDASPFSAASRRWPTRAPSTPPSRRCRRAESVV